MSAETKGKAFHANDVSEFIASKYDYLGPAYLATLGDSFPPLLRKESSTGEKSGRGRSAKIKANSSPV